MKTTVTISVPGHDVRVRTDKTYVVTMAREHPVKVEDGTLIPFAHVITQTDSLATAKRRIRKETEHLAPGANLYLYDVETGELL